MKEHMQGLIAHFGVEVSLYEGEDFVAVSPVNGEPIGRYRYDSDLMVGEKIQAASEAFHLWKQVPAPKRSEVIRQLGLLTREHKQPLAEIIVLETGKLLSESLAEVQEVIDMCDYAVGLSRQIGGLTLPSERSQHEMQEQWYPLGVVGILSAFNFPMAVWAWNACLALICGNAIIWKPSQKAFLSAIVMHDLLEQSIQKAGFDASLRDISQLVLGDIHQATLMVDHPKIRLLSATGSCHMGKNVAPKVAARLGRSLLELGGNNAVIVSQYADLKVAIPSIVFGAVGTQGQRCTTTRRLFVHQDQYLKVMQQLQSAYQRLMDGRIGNPFQSQTLVGPLIDEHAYEQMQKALKTAKAEGGHVHFGYRMMMESSDSYYVVPALVEMPTQTAIVKDETFAPILYVMPYENFQSTVDAVNDVPQGLSASIFSTDIREACYFRSHVDCGIVNINIGTSGAEIGGAFGGEKDTGGGRESGSDSWKQYMRRVTSTSYYGYQAPELAQGLDFSIT